MAESRPDADVALAIETHQMLLSALERAVENGTLDVTAPSHLPHWSKGHVITHVVNSGDGHIGIFGAAARGEVRAQYPHGIEGRAADIEAGAPRPGVEQLDDLRRSITALEACWESTDWNGVGITPRGGEVAIAELPFFRAREAAVHLVDLDIGVGFEDLPQRYVELETERMTAQWHAEQSTDAAVLPTQVSELAVPQQLAWLMGRLVIDGLDPADVF